jgi:alkylation response protein AidB-like acyl-CoA dehydrogenase
VELELSEEQEHLREGLRQLLEGACGLRRVREVAYDGDGRDAKLWRELVEGGWSASLVAEAEGGGGLGFEEALIVALESGRALLPLPLVETLLASRALARAGHAEGVSSIASGASYTLALQCGSADWGAPPGACAAARVGDGRWRLAGEQRGVPFGPSSEFCLVEAALAGGGSGLFRVPCDAPGTCWQEVGAFDRTVRRYRLTLDGVELGSDASLFGEQPADAEIERLVDEWRVLLAAQSQGACRRVLEMTVDYVKKRQQFGRPVGANQAVKVRLADAAAAVERMQAALYHAALKIAQEAPDRALAAAMAKAACAAPAAFVATQAVHCHGAIGYTWEQDVHLFVKRIKSSELLLGDGHASLERIAQLVL